MELRGRRGSLCGIEFSIGLHFVAIKGHTKTTEWVVLWCTNSKKMCKVLLYKYIFSVYMVPHRKGRYAMTDDLVLLFVWLKWLLQSWSEVNIKLICNKCRQKQPMPDINTCVCTTIARWYEFPGCWSHIMIQIENGSLGSLGFFSLP